MKLTIVQVGAIAAAVFFFLLGVAIGGLIEKIVHDCPEPVVDRFVFPTFEIVVGEKFPDTVRVCYPDDTATYWLDPSPGTVSIAAVDSLLTPFIQYVDGLFWRWELLKATGRL